MIRSLCRRSKRIAAALAPALLCTSLLAALGAGLPASAAERGDAGHACLLVDTDAATDDFRAFAVLFPHRELRAVVVTEGISSVPRGTTAIATLLAGGLSRAPVISGLASPAPPAYDWLPAVRAAAERLNGYLSRAVPTAASQGELSGHLTSALAGCRSVDILILGPWTSFVEYAPVIRPSIHRVVGSGRPVSENNPDNFNCVYDQAACDKADVFLRSVRSAVWVDLPADGTSYPPTQAMIDQLGSAGLPGVLHAILDTDPSQWQGTRLWDDTTALYLLRPELFRLNGAHFEPAVDEDTLRAALVGAINAIRTR